MLFTKYFMLLVKQSGYHEPLAAVCIAAYRDVQGQQVFHKQLSSACKSCMSESHAHVPKCNR